MYRKYPPDIRLQHLVECYWSNTEIAPTTAPIRVYPDGCVDILFSFSKNNSANPKEHGQPHIAGTFSFSFDVAPQSFGLQEMMGIRFNPTGFTAFTRTPIHQFTNNWTDIPLIESLFDSSFYEPLSELKDTMKRLKHIEDYLISLLPVLYTPDQRIAHAAGIILGSQGQVSIKELAHTVCLSERQFERRFKASLGLSPKKFNKIIRFRHTREYIRLHPQESLWTVAIACGYHDDSHLTKDFKALGGIMPKIVND